MPILFGSYCYHVTLGALYLGKLGNRILNISLKLAFIICVIVFPFSLYQYFTQIPYLPYYMENPLAFLGITTLSIVFSFKYFNQPAYFENNQLSEYFKKQFNITKREGEIISLVIQGHANNTIGEKLFISPRTVESHLYKIFQKANIKNRTQLINLIVSNKKE